MPEPLDQGVCCLRCGYNLTGVIDGGAPQGRCPECGAANDYWLIRNETRGVRKRWLIVSLLAMPFFWAWAFPLGCCCSGLGLMRFDGSWWWLVAGGGVPVLALSVLHGRHLTRSVASWRRTRGLPAVWWTHWGWVSLAELLLSAVYLATLAGVIAALSILTPSLL